ncbi:24536_t:CDS:2 [Cetraspora pellucida]|uniref:24536_t:CDS:1 n=1 Tax=Cetraspora pellucida TaxID=1433469 RepID=A0A9N9B501_9GLOM|nr:24536_t:CDS:2 [Cetraspora pellucida]
MANLASSLGNDNFHFNLDINVKEPILGSSLTGKIAGILPINYSYIINEFFTKNDNSNEELSANANKESNANGDEESDRIESLASFFHEMERDVKQNTQLLLAFEKFQKGYHNAKNLSENKLVSFVYQHASSSATIRSGKKIPVQVTSVQRRKETTRQALGRQLLGKENEDLHEMLPRKKEK